MKRLYRVSEGKIIAGVCTGFAEYFNVDVTLIRLLFIAFAFLEGLGILVYLISWIIMPVKKVGEEKTEEKKEQIETPENENKVKTNMIVGMIFVFLGILILINYYFEIFKFVKFWPILLILIGIFFIIKGGRNEKR